MADGIGTCGIDLGIVSDCKLNVNLQSDVTEKGKVGFYQES